MRNSRFYKSHCTEEMTAAMKAEEIYVNSTALPGTIKRLSPEGATGRISKKRSRASRRAHTTVLNTDKANFKTMVQHFTGITSANTAASALSPISESFEDYFLPKSIPADHDQQYSSARLKSVDANKPPFAFYASRPHESLYLPNFPFAESSSKGMIPNFFNNKDPMANNSQRQGMADLSSASLWEELILGMDLPASGLYTNM